MRLNGAACALKLENYPRVEELCSEVLMTTPTNPKALFRRGQARLARRNYDGAEADFSAGAASHPEDASFTTGLAHAKAAARKEEKKKAKVYASLFSSSS
eukprot:TRINITY_DN402_c0_g1_i2.p2 TRINITY_DN402_c0_g1~~TRINITY_DN402_c0_g1_i2.p2  ORF type:complete len:100 (-),score=59.79 TRINITY_DN402_c0_g1_i2:49-348(-)